MHSYKRITASSSLYLSLFNHKMIISFPFMFFYQFWHLCEHWERNCLRKIRFKTFQQCLIILKTINNLVFLWQILHYFEMKFLKQLHFLEWNFIIPLLFLMGSPKKLFFEKKLQYFLEKSILKSISCIFAFINWE